MPKQPNYVVKAGVVIHPFGTSDFYTNPLTDEVALDFLARHENNVNLFAQLPSDWREQLERHIAKKAAAETSAPADDAEEEKPTEETAEAPKASKRKNAKKTAE